MMNNDFNRLQTNSNHDIGSNRDNESGNKNIISNSGSSNVNINIPQIRETSQNRSGRRRKCRAENRSQGRVQSESENRSGRRRKCRAENRSQCRRNPFRFF